MRVACVFIPYFAVRLERRDRPELRAAPLVVGGAPHERQAVQDCSPDARRAGVQAGMSLRRALALCREARFVEARAALYGDTVSAIADALETAAPRVEIEPAETFAEACFYLDLTGMERLWPEERALAAHVIDVVRQACRLTPRVGIADGRAAARAASQKDDFGSMIDERVHHSSIIDPKSSFRIVPPGHTPSFLASLPLDAVAMPGELRARLRLFGIRTLGALAALPSGAVAAQFGPVGLRAWETARGVDRRPFVPRVRHATVSDELELPAPTAEQEAILAAARILLRRLLRRPEIGNRLVRRVSARAVLERAEVVREMALSPDSADLSPNPSPTRRGEPRQDRDAGATVGSPRPASSAEPAGPGSPLLVGEGLGERSAGLSADYHLLLHDPTDDPERILFLLRHKLEAAALPGPVQRLQVTLADFCGERGRQEGMFAAKGRRIVQLEESIRALRVRYGRSPILRLVPVEPWSRIPERRLALAAYEC